MKKSGNSHIFHYLLKSNETGINITLDTIGYILVYSFENKEYGKGLSQNAIEHKVNCIILLTSSNKSSLKVGRETLKLPMLVGGMSIFEEFHVSNVVLLIIRYQ